MRERSGYKAWLQSLGKTRRDGRSTSWPTAWPPGGRPPAERPRDQELVGLAAQVLEPTSP
jgi:hypothetical protein